jgi:hypothetical protein
MFRRIILPFTTSNNFLGLVSLSKKASVGKPVNKITPAYYNRYQQDTVATELEPPAIAFCEASAISTITSMSVIPKLPDSLLSIILNNINNASILLILLQ